MTTAEKLRRWKLLAKKRAGIIARRTEALTKLLRAVEPTIPHHSGCCIDFTQKDWPVTEQSCKCSEETKQLRKAVRAGRAALGYKPAESSSRIS